jgi:hypothetical protein
MPAPIRIGESHGTGPHPAVSMATDVHARILPIPAPLTQRRMAHCPIRTILAYRNALRPLKAGSPREGTLQPPLGRRRKAADGLRAYPGDAGACPSPESPCLGPGRIMNPGSLRREAGGVDGRSVPLRGKAKFQLDA